MDLEKCKQINQFPTFYKIITSCIMVVRSLRREGGIQSREGGGLSRVEKGEAFCYIFQFTISIPVNDPPPSSNFKSAP